MPPAAAQTRYESTKQPKDADDYKNAVDCMFPGLVKRKPGCFAVRQYHKYKLASGVVCSKRLIKNAHAQGSQNGAF